MLRTAVPVLLLLAACDTLNGDPEHDYNALTDTVDVDCGAESLCGLQPHCMSDALRDGKVGTVANKIPGTSPEDPNIHVEYLFTYDGEVIVITKSYADPDYGSFREKRCLLLELVPTSPTSTCWKWDASNCML